MQTRRDQVQAHMFVSGRLVSAMLRAEPDAPQTPLRRFGVATFVGVMLAVLGLAGFAVFGYIRPGGATAWRKPGTLIVEKETGARYVLIDGQLKPVLNYASARLILGGAPNVVRASRNSLAGVPHGLPVGIESAPDALPDPKRLQQLAGRRWQVCSALQPDETGVDRPFVTLQVGTAEVGTQLGGDEALLVATPDGTTYLAWQNRRLRIREPAVVDALGYGAARKHLVGIAWINALPAGPDIAPPAVPGRGEPGTMIGGRLRRVGQLFAVRGAPTGDQHYLLTRDGLAPLTPTGAALVIGTGMTAAPLSPAELAIAPRAPKSLIAPGLPVSPPLPMAAGDGDAPCLQATVGTQAGADVRVALAAPAGGASAGGRAGGSGLADRVSVEAGGGLLIRAQPGPGVAAGTKFLLVDTGVRYPLPANEVADALGYAGVAAVPVPSTLLGLVPAGRPLDPEAAKTTAPLSPQAQLPT